MVVGSNFLDERGPIAGVGPITVHPASQNQAIGRQLMGAVLDRASERGAAGVRLLQSAFHNRSLWLYAKLGSESRETISKMNGAPLGVKFPGYDVRPARTADLAACNALCQRVHGHHQLRLPAWYRRVRLASANPTASSIIVLGSGTTAGGCGPNEKGGSASGVLLDVAIE